MTSLQLKILAAKLQREDDSAQRCTETVSSAVIALLIRRQAQEAK